MNQKFETNFTSNIETFVRCQENTDGSVSVFYKQYEDADKGALRTAIESIIGFVGALVLIFFTFGLAIPFIIGGIFWWVAKPRSEKEVRVYPNQGLQVNDRRVSKHDIDGFSEQVLSKPRKVYSAAYANVGGSSFYLTGYTDPTISDKVIRTIADLL